MQGSTNRCELVFKPRDKRPASEHADINDFASSVIKFGTQWCALGTQVKKRDVGVPACLGLFS